MGTHITNHLSRYLKSELNSLSFPSSTAGNQTSFNGLPGRVSSFSRNELGFTLQPWNKTQSDSVFSQHHISPEKNYLPKTLKPTGLWPNREATNP